MSKSCRQEQRRFYHVGVLDSGWHGVGRVERLVGLIALFSEQQMNVIPNKRTLVMSEHSYTPVSRYSFIRLKYSLHYSINRLYIK